MFSLSSPYEFYITERIDHLAYLTKIFWAEQLGGQSNTWQHKLPTLQTTRTHSGSYVDLWSQTQNITPEICKYLRLV